MLALNPLVKYTNTQYTYTHTSTHEACTNNVTIILVFYIDVMHMPGA